MITSVPTVPTDSLYKFIAYVGAALVVASGLYLLVLADKEANLQARMDALNTVMYRNHKSFEEESDRLEKWFEQHPRPSSTQATVFYDLLGQNITGYKDTVALYREWADSYKTNTRHRRLCYWGLGVGGIMSVIGFFLWYRLVQRPTDRLLREQLAEAIRKSEGK